MAALIALPKSGRSSTMAQRKEAMDILGLSEFTTVLCHTLLYLPLLSA